MDVFWVLMLISLAAVPLALSLRKVKLGGAIQSMSAIEHRPHGGMDVGGSMIFQRGESQRGRWSKTQAMSSESFTDRHPNSTRTAAYCLRNENPS
jgi:hypothetical protein